MLLALTTLTTRRIERARAQSRHLPADVSTRENEHLAGCPRDVTPSEWLALTQHLRVIVVVYIRARARAASSLNLLRFADTHTRESISAPASLERSLARSLIRLANSTSMIALVR